MKPTTRKVALKLLLGTGIMLAIAVGAVAVLSARALDAKFEPPAGKLAILSTPAAIARGAYLARHLMGCTDCHAPDLGGAPLMDAQPMGRVWAPNITAGSGGVTTKYDAATWQTLLRYGVLPDGRRALIMPVEDYWQFSDADLAAVVAYVRSVPPVDRASLGNAPGFLPRLLITLGEV